ncbi:C40 family peptidase [Streptacidiphilus cavernicola]|uniref:NlpC/P60 family protein n=1 Tax=Streptacidiphilus cavernicola TaxID=3342716 RepID=A0ABV6W2U5_9ACTN
MTSHRRPRSPGRARISALTAAATTVAATTVALSAVAAQSAQGAPPPTAAQLKAQIDRQNQEADQEIQQYDATQSRQQALQKQVAVLQDQVARQQALVSAKSAVLGQVAAAQYRDGSIDPSVQLMLSSDPTEYLNRASTLSQLTDSQAAVLAQLLSEQRTLSRERADAGDKLAALDAATRQLAKEKASVQRKLAAAKAQLAALTTAQRSAVARLRGDGGNAAYHPASAGSGVGGRAFAAAETRLNDPYIWNHTGPDSFDCSGLTQWAYKQAGLSIGRTTYDQINSGTPVTSTADLQIGDLVFFNGNTHVGLYAGGGYVLHAPHSGTVVKFEKMSYIGTIYAMRHI